MSCSHSGYASQGALIKFLSGKAASEETEFTDGLKAASSGKALNQSLARIWCVFPSQTARSPPALVTVLPHTNPHRCQAKLE